jgi:hypothetical protein
VKTHSDDVLDGKNRLIHARDEQGARLGELPVSHEANRALELSLRVEVQPRPLRPLGLAPTAVAPRRTGRRAVLADAPQSKALLVNQLRFKAASRWLSEQEVVESKVPLERSVDRRLVSRRFGSERSSLQGRP